MLDEPFELERAGARGAPSRPVGELRVADERRDHVERLDRSGHKL